jgi:predicted metal-dependent hydrolase
MRWLKALSKVISQRRASAEPPLKAKVHDLQSLYQEINLRYFQGELSLSIDWFGYKNTSRRISRKVLGYYDERGKRVRIHRSLDSVDFPPFFVAYIVYHEMLHSVERPLQGRGRRKVHHSAFKVREKQFHAYHEAKAWEKDNLHRILNGR